AVAVRIPGTPPQYGTRFVDPVPIAADQSLEFDGGSPQAARPHRWPPLPIMMVLPIKQETPDHDVQIRAQRASAREPLQRRVIAFEEIEVRPLRKIGSFIGRKASGPCDIVD